MTDIKAITLGTPSDRLGSVGQLDDGGAFVLFNRRLAHSVERVWAAITDPEQLAAWAPGFSFEQTVGGKLEIWFGGDCEGPAHVTGTVTEYDPPRVLAMGSMRFELEPDGDGCLLRFTDVLHFAGPRTKTEFSNSVLSGWHRYLDHLEHWLEKRPIDHDQPEMVDYSLLDVPGRP